MSPHDCLCDCTSPLTCVLGDVHIHHVVCASRQGLLMNVHSALTACIVSVLQLLMLLSCHLQRSWTACINRANPACSHHK